MKGGVVMPADYRTKVYKLHASGDSKIKDVFDFIELQGVWPDLETRAYYNIYDTTDKMDGLDLPNNYEVTITIVKNKGTKKK